MSDPKTVTFRYRNYRGEEADRTVLPICIWWGSTHWHPEPQWLLAVYDKDKMDNRDFALSGILGPWRPVV